MEAALHEEMKTRLVESGNLLESLLRAVDGDVDEQRALTHPIDTTAFRASLGRPPMVGWTCTPATVFLSSNLNLANNTFGLVRRQRDWIKAVSAGQSVMPDVTLASVSRNTWM